MPRKKYPEGPEQSKKLIFWHFKSILHDLKRKNIKFLCCFWPSGYFFLAFQTMRICLAKSRFFRFSRPYKVFFYRDPVKKTLCGVRKIEKIDFSPNKIPQFEMPRKNVGRVQNNIKSWYFCVSNPGALIWSPCSIILVWIFYEGKCDCPIKKLLIPTKIFFIQCVFMLL